MNFIIMILLSSMLVSCTTTTHPAGYYTGIDPKEMFQMRRNCTGKNRTEVETLLGKPSETYENTNILNKKIIVEVYKTIGGPEAVETTMDEWDSTYQKFKLKKRTTMISTSMRLLMFYYPEGDEVISCSSNF